jgi:casein kinase II subunit beta
MESVQQAKELYGLIHARFITSGKGLALMRQKYLNSVFGNCPRILCDKQNLLPIGLSEELKYSRVKVFCPNCEEVYKPRQKCSEIDGAYFGSSFPQIFFMVNFLLIS